MGWLRTPLLIGLLASAGCVSTAPEPRAGLLTAQVTAEAAAQVRRCYRQPRIPHAGRQIITRLRVRYGPDGALAGLPSVVWQSGVTADNRLYAVPMAEAAMAAVIRCAPIHLPPDYYVKGLDEIDLTFSPGAAV